MSAGHEGAAAAAGEGVAPAAAAGEGVAPAAAAGEGAGQAAAAGVGKQTTGGGGRDEAQAARADMAAVRAGNAAARRGRFVTFEGIDGAGKTSHIESLAGWLRARGHEVVLTREPGGTPLAEALREIVLHRSMDALTEALLVFAARRDHVQARIEPALAAGATVLCDRFTDASFAYQGGGRGVDWQTLEALERWVQQGLQPDLTLWFDVAPAVAAGRRGAARTPDRFESQDEGFFRRVAAGYARRLDDDPTRFARIDAGTDRTAVWAQVEAAVATRGWW